MANKYCNLDGTKKISEEYPKINVGFEKVETDVVALDARVTTIITTPLDGLASTQEIIDARQGELSLGANLTGVKSQLARNANDVLGRGLNIKIPFETSLSPAIGDGVADDTIAILAMVDYCKINSIETLIIPYGTFKINQNIIIDFPLSIIGFGLSSIIKLGSNVDGFILKSSYDRIKDIKMKADSDTYTSNMITITHPTGSHAWDHYVSNVYFHGGSTLATGTAILMLANDKGVMGTVIDKTHFLKMESGIKFSVLNATLGFINGGTVRDSWVDYTKYTFNFEGNNISRWLFDNCKGQFNVGWSEYHFYNIKGTGHKILTSLQWDGGIYLIHQKSSNLYIDAYSTNGVITGIIDKGYRTFIESIPLSIGGNTGQGWVNIIDDFVGYNLKNEWRKVVTGTASIIQKLDTSTPYTQGLLLSTGTTINSIARADYGQNYVFNRYTQSLVTMYFKAITNNVEARLGFISTSDTQEMTIIVSPLHLNFMFKISTDLYDTGILKDNNYHSFQITKYQASSLELFFDGEHIETVTTGISIYDQEPIIEIKNGSSATNEELFVTNFYGRFGYRLIN